MKRVRLLPIYLALLVVCTFFVFPFYWVIISSLKSVPGMDLEPPTLYPAEQLTVDVKVPTAGRTFSSSTGEWLLLKRSAPKIREPGQSGEGGYYLQLSAGKPTQLVNWISYAKLSPKAWPAKTIELPSVLVEDIGGRREAVLAKMVRQKANSYDELLFMTAPSSGQLGSVEIGQNLPHKDIRYLSAHFDNFAKALQGPEASIGGKSEGFILFMRNSLFISGMAVLGQILSSSLVAYGFSRLYFKGRDALFIVLVATLMVPAQVTLIPLFSIYKSLGWLDSFLPLIVPQFTAGAFNVFLIRQFMLGLPRELDESAEIDGATKFGIFRSIVFPNCAPVLIVVGLFTFVGSWQDVMGPLIYLDNPAYRTVSLGLEYFRSPYVDNRPLLMAGALLSMLPVAALFLVAQRYIMSGIATTGLKG